MKHVVTGYRPSDSTEAKAWAKEMPHFDPETQERCKCQLICKDGALFCLRPKAHQGNHAAHSARDHVEARWEGENEVKA